MSLIDRVAEWLQRILAVFDPDTAYLLSVPALVVVVVLGTVVAVRKLVPPACRLAVAVLRVAVTVVGAAVLLLDLFVATGFRQATVKPPAFLYNFGDAVSAAVASVNSRTHTVAAAAARIARINVVLLVVAALGWIWLWNYRQCPNEAQGCTRPVSTWYTTVRDK